MVSIGCVQGQAEGLREQLALVPISEGIPQDVLESFGFRRARRVFRIFTLLQTGSN